MKRTNEKGYVRTQLERICVDAGESIEETLRRLTANKEPVPQNVPPIYTPLSEGVLPDTDIRADRFDVAIAAQDKFAASKAAKAAEIAKQEIQQLTTEGE